MIDPDWKMIQAPKAQVEYNFFFKMEDLFQGTGWYLCNNDTVLVTKDFLNDELYECYVWNGYDPREDINKLTLLPTYKLPPGPRQW